LRVIAGVPAGTPASIAATRDRYMSRGSVWMTLPKTTCSIASGAISARAIASVAQWAPSVVGGMSFNEPEKVPIAVRAPDRMTTSVFESDMEFPLRCLVGRLRADAGARVGPDNSARVRR